MPRRRSRIMMSPARTGCPVLGQRLAVGRASRGSCRRSPGRARRSRLVARARAVSGSGHGSSAARWRRAAASGQSSTRPGALARRWHVREHVLGARPRRAAPRVARTRRRRGPGRLGRAERAIERLARIRAGRRRRPRASSNARKRAEVGEVGALEADRSTASRRRPRTACAGSAARTFAGEELLGQPPG